MSMGSNPIDFLWIYKISSFVFHMEEEGHEVSNRFGLRFNTKTPALVVTVGRHGWPYLYSCEPVQSVQICTLHSRPTRDFFSF